MAALYTKLSGYREGVATSAANVEAICQPDPNPPAPEQHSPGRALVLYTYWVIYMLQNPLPDVRIGDELHDPNEIDQFTGLPAVYMVKRASTWGGDHLEIKADRLASKPST